MAKKAAATAANSDVDSAGDQPVQFLNKIRPKDVMEANIKKLAPAEGEPQKELFTVFGVASGLKHGDSTYGAWEALTGIFEARRASDGQRFQSGVCFLPGATGEMLIGGLKAAKEADPDASVHFGIIVGIKFSEVAIGYEFTTKNVVKVAQADPLSDLRAKALGYDKKE